jgi:hypothetical protein
VIAIWLTSSKDWSVNETNFFVAHGTIQSSLTTIRSIACLTPKRAPFQMDAPIGEETHHYKVVKIPFSLPNDTHDLTFFTLNPIFAMHDFTEEYCTDGVFSQTQDGGRAARSGW